jgi:REP-associated tyrosine transposase
MYAFRDMSPDLRARVVACRKASGLPWHSPPHGNMGYTGRHLISAVCYLHRRYIGVSPERMSECENEILSICEEAGYEVYAWCVLPNHYHLLLRCDAIKHFCREVGKFHGSSSKRWNQEDGQFGRKVWYRCLDREMRSTRHFYASLNYIHHNPVHHSYVDKWADWPWSSAALFLDKTERDEVERIWRDYPILDYGKKWDVD